MARQVIAFADPSGYVTPPPLNIPLSEFANDSLLTPLFSQEEVEASMARFYEGQGLNPDGSEKLPVVADVLETQTAQIEQAAEDRASESKKNTGISVAEAAMEALNAVGK